MLTYNELKKGVIFELDGQPYEVLDYEFLRMQQRKPVAKTKIKNLITGKIVERNFHQNENFAEVEIEKKPIKYLYNHRGEYWFAEIDNPGKRFSLKEATVGPAARFLKPNSEVKAVKFRENIINVEPPIKIDLKVKEAPPGIRGDTAQGGTKNAVLETGATVAVPLFVNAGDTIRINTETGAYVERIEKSKE
ncbi:MAG TPA: elongation factor P [Candidatus Paceibacterota bacterium]